MKPTFGPLLWPLTTLALLWSGRAQAVELSLTAPEPTPHGEVTTFSVELSEPLGAAEVRWDFGDGTGTEFSANETTVDHTYDSPGHYTVTALAQDEGGFASDTFIHTVHTPVTEQQPRSSSSLLVDSERGLVVAANTDNGTVTVVDATTFEVKREIEVFDDPVAMALTPGGDLWVLHKEDYAVAIVDLDQFRAVDFFRLPYASQPSGIVVSSQGDAFVTLSALGEVARVDGTTHQVVARRSLAPSLRGITIAGDEQDLWVTRFVSQEDHGEVYRLDTATLETVARYDLMEDTTTEDSDVQGRGLPNYLFSVAVSPDGTRAWVPSKKDNMARGLMRDGLALTPDNAVRPLVSILDLTTDEELMSLRIDLDDRNLPRQVTFTALGDWAFVSVFGSNLIELRDAFDRSFVTALRAEKLLGPVATVMLPGDRLAALAGSARRLLVFDVGDLLTGVDQSTQLVAEVPLVEDEALPEEVLRGKRIFENAEDKRMASEGYLSCASCHFEGNDDGRVWDFFDRGEGFRNTISLLGRRGMGHGRLHWSGNFDEVQDFENDIRAHQGGLGFIPADQFDAVSDPLGAPKAGLSADLDALAAYVAAFDVVPRSPFRNPDGTLTEQGEAGRALFLDLGCDSCHAGDDFTDSATGELHDVGTMTANSGNRLGEELTGIDTPTLLGIWQTAPYLHDGSATTLLDVLTTRNPEGMHGDTSLLTEQELNSLVAYLQQIDHGLPAEELVLPTGEGMGGMGGASPQPPTGGAAANGGGPTAGGATAAGGATSTGGAMATGGAPNTSGAGGYAPTDDPFQDTGRGCGCKLSSGRQGPPGRKAWWGLVALVLMLVLRRGRPHVAARTLLNK